MLAGAVASARALKTECRILHMSSGAGRSAYPGWSVYCATKAALDQHARAVALDHNINLRIVQPGARRHRYRHAGRDPRRRRSSSFRCAKDSTNSSAPASWPTRRRPRRRLVDYLLGEHFGKATGR